MTKSRIAVVVGCIFLPVFACWLSLRVHNFQPAIQWEPWLRNGMLISLVLNLAWLMLWASVRPDSRNWLTLVAISVNLLGVFLAYLAYLTVIYS